MRLKELIVNIEVNIINKKESKKILVQPKLQNKN